MTQIEADLIVNTMMQSLVVCLFTGFIVGIALHDFLGYWIDVSLRYLRRHLFRAKRIAK